MVNNTRIRSPKPRPDRPARLPLVIPTVKDAKEKWIASRQLYRDITDKTVTFYTEQTKALIDLVGEDSAITDIRLEDVERVMADVKARGSKVHPSFRAMRAFLMWCGRQGWEMDRRFGFGWDQPYDRLTDDERVQIYTPKQMTALRSYFTKKSLRDALVHGLLLSTGIRLNELIHLTLDDRQDGDTLVVRFAKGKKTRWLRLRKELQNDWKAYVTEERPADARTDVLLVTAKRIVRNGAFDYHPMQPRAVQSMMTKAEKALGFAVHAHKYRHSYATYWVANQLREGKVPDYEELRRALGHTDYSLFDTYVNLARDMIRKGTENYSPY